MSDQGIKKKVFLISLGCAKNLVDSENILGLITGKGFQIAKELNTAEIAVINTCGFIQSAVEETIDTIFEVTEQKKAGRLEKVVVVGCFVQRYGYKLRKEIPEVDGWVGTGELLKIGEILGNSSGKSTPFFIGRPSYLADHTTPRNRTTPFYTAYLKIAEGCSHRCTFCTIPGLRGPLRSRTMESVIIEAEQLVDRGVKEVNLIAQDTTMYGRDHDKPTSLEDLLEALLRVEGIGWIRVLYSHPHRISERLLALMENDNAICPYLDIPLQHVNERVLQDMGRGFTGQDPRQLLERVRRRSPNLALRTTVMVGFPGETDEIFKELYQFVETAQFDHLGVFVYSKEKGTVAAGYKKLVERKVAEERLDAIMRLQAEVSRKKNLAMVGQSVQVLHEGVSTETELLMRGRTRKMAPDVDGQVLINKGRAEVGGFVRVRIKEAHEYDLIGEII